MTDDTTTTKPDDVTTDPTELTADELTAVDGTRADLRPTTSKLTDDVNNVTTELSTEDRAALDSFRPDAGPSARDRWSSPRTGQHDAARLAPALHLSKTFPEWHGIGTPAEVVTAREAFDAARDAERAARAEHAAIPARRAAERAAVGEAAAEGREVQALTDWDREAIVLSAKADVLAKATRAALAGYETAVKNSLPAWRASLVDAIAPAREAAREAFQGVEPAVSAWLTAIDAAAAIDAVVHKGDPLPTTPLAEPHGNVLAEGRRAAPALAALLSSSHPVVDGSYLQRKNSLRPPRYVRAALDEGTYAQRTQLFAIESRENFAFTDFTRDFAARYFVDDLGELRPKGPTWNDSIKSL